MTHYRKLCAVIAILQDHILADDANCDPAKLFPLGRYSTDSLEVAVQLATEVLDVLEKVEG
ncbi:hypothetical protein Q4543_23805 [Salipiger sp. 1_MG-2023]|uniref:hypothetical protein n=1 Tax=Salipiger sp. 1_MG-2023 TaxID=3062665 RepID=UPI0026E472C6|nr:hypothetical protein [Salipiger sp. 1_MG-2023]MDO6588506.1 hypothetical protein [Salipiger sp. 1_MG-2023]